MKIKGNYFWSVLILTLILYQNYKQPQYLITQITNSIMKTIEVKVYQFNELSKEAQQNAILNTQMDESYLDYEWYDGVYEDAKTIGNLIGIDIDNIYWSGFSSQGDGACFEGKYIYKKSSVKAVKEYAPEDKELHRIALELQKEQKKYFYLLYADVKQRGHYNHEMCTDIDVDIDNSYQYVTGDTESNIKELLRDYMRWIYKQLESSYDYLMSDESIQEHLLSNEYEFEEDGSRY